MNEANVRRALAVAVRAAKAAGKVMRRNLRLSKTVNEATSHDIKLELDVRCQRLIERTLHKTFPKIPLLGEEGASGNTSDIYRWVVDPIDGTVNFAYGIPHACVSVALQWKSPKSRVQGPKSRKHATRNTQHVTLIGVVYDPFTDELWTAVRGQRARLNGQIIRASRRGKLSEAVVSTGFSKSKEQLEKSLPYFNNLAGRVRKIRIMGAAALSLVYVATGRFDAYIERSVSLWDIAAGGLIVECAGGEFWREKIPGDFKYRIIISNGLLRRQLAKGWK